jgi:hypothetical protein
MAVTEAVSRSMGEAVFPSDNDAAPASGDAASSSGGKGAAFLLATLLTLGSVGVLGYTQWWVPREQAQEVAKVKYEHCLVEVKVYRGKHSYANRLAQCTKFLNS